MPRQQTVMKDVAGCEKPRGVVKHALIRGYPNGATRSTSVGHPLTEYIGLRSTTQGIETSQYLEEKKSKEISLVVVSERETA